MGRIRGRAFAAACGGLLLAAAAGGAAAQGTARSLDIDTSVRSSGRGGASVAVFQDGGSEWVNPALLGYRDGFSVTYDRHQLVPDLADDVVLSSRRVSLGLWGLGFSSAGLPADAIGGTDLDYGESVATDPYGNPISIARSVERVRSWSAGLSVATLADHVAGARGRAGKLSDWADLAAGVSLKQVRMTFYGAEVGETDAADWGVLVRVSPIDTRRGGAAGRTQRLDLAFGHSVLNANDAAVDFGWAGPVPTSRLRRDGWSAGWTLRAEEGELAPGRWLRRVAGRDGALLRVLVAMDQEHVGTTDEDEGATYGVDRWGVEAALGRVAALRFGHVRDREGDIDGYAWGFGLGAPLGPLAEVAYDYAHTPQAQQLDGRPSHAVTLRLDVLGTLGHWKKEAADARTK